MNTKKVFYLLLNISLVTLSSCGKKDDGAFSISGNINPLNTQIEKISYQFKTEGLNFCDTGKQEFLANTKGALKKLLCEGLQDQEKNNFCAENLRFKYFSKVCSDEYLWSPYSINKDRKKTKQEENKTIEENIISQLQYLYIDDAQLLNNLPKDEKLALKQYLESIDLCGLEYMTPPCNNTQITHKENHVLLEENSDKIFVVNLTSYNPDSKKIKLPPLLLAFKLKAHPVSGINQATKLIIYKKILPIYGKTLSEYYADKESIREIAIVNIADNFFDKAWFKLNGPRNIVEFFHASDFLLNQNPNYTDKIEIIKNKIAEVILKNEDLLINTDNFNYVKRFFTLVKNKFYETKDPKQQIFNIFLKIKNNEINEIAATELLLMSPDRSNLKKLVLKALNHDNSNTRADAIIALSKTQMSINEEIAIIDLISDTNYDVRTDAYTVASKFNLSELHLSALTKLSKNDMQEVRLMSLDLLSKISGKNSNLKFIDALNDNNYENNTKAFNHLMKQTLDKDYIYLFEKNLSNDNNTLRLRSVKLLNKIQDDEVTEILIKQLADNSYDVTTFLNENLGKRNLSERMLNELALISLNQTASVRMSAINLINKISGDKATLLLISSLTDNNYYNYSAAFNFLKNRILNETHIQPLATLLRTEDNIDSTKMHAAELLGMIKHHDALSALENQLKIETNYYVKMALIQAVKNIKNK